MIVCIFGKPGSGKSVLSKNYMMQIGGRIIFLSPVEQIQRLQYIDVWQLESIPSLMRHQKPGQILLIKLADVEALDVVCAQAIAEPLGYTIIIDEMDRYQQSSELLDAIHYSRHFDIHLIGNTRRYTNMPRLMTGMATDMCVFKSQEPADLHYLREFAGKEFSEACRHLPEYRYLHYPTSTIRTASISTL